MYYSQLSLMKSWEYEDFLPLASVHCHLTAVVLGGVYIGVRSQRNLFAA